MYGSFLIHLLHLKKYSYNNPLEPNFKKSPTDLLITSSLTPFLFLYINASLLREKEVMISAIQDPNFNRDLPHLFIRSFVNAESFPFFIPRRCFMEVSLPRTIHRNDISTSRYNAERTLCHPFETRLAGETAGGTWRKKREKKKKLSAPTELPMIQGTLFLRQRLFIIRQRFENVSARVVPSIILNTRGARVRNAWTRGVPCPGTKHWFIDAFIRGERGANKSAGAYYFRKSIDRERGRLVENGFRKFIFQFFSCFFLSLSRRAKTRAAKMISDRANRK